MDKNAIYRTKLCLIRHDLGGALETIRPLMEDLAYARLHDTITQVDGDYQRMLSYLRQGYPDPSRDKMYLSLLRKLDRCVNDAALILRTQKDPRQSVYATKSQRFMLSEQDTAKRIEDFVSETALSQLDGADDSHLEELYKSHHELMSSLFEHLCFSPQWHRSDQEFYESLILSPTIDITDAALLTSAITLSVITHFDIHKYITLAHIYQKAGDEQLRQRALVGWALTTTRSHTLYDEVRPLVEDILHDEQSSQQVLETQMQMILCMNAEQDQETITRDIMPNIMKNKGFDITRNGIVEKEDDPMQDILHPDADDKAMEELEASINKMVNMQKAGSDIYFGGFSQMKRFSFFYTLSNWFIPFYLEHPGITHVAEKLKGMRFLQILLDSGPFCDSDKYSFALAMLSVFDKIPANMREMLNNREAIGPTMDDSDKQSPAYIRRMYLQDLYRFFRVYQQKNDFETPFDYEKNPDRFFFANPAFGGTSLKEMFAKMGRFLIKQKRYDCLRLMLEQQIWPTDETEHDLFEALLAMNEGRYNYATICFSRVT